MVAYSLKENGLVLSAELATESPAQLVATDKQLFAINTTADGVTTQYWTGTELKATDWTSQFVASNLPQHQSLLRINGDAPQQYYARNWGLKRYELNDHLGNVRATVSDRLLRLDGTLTAEVESFANYYPFGWTMPGLEGNFGNYRYGFNGMEKDDELSNNGSLYTSLYRINDTRLGRWFSVDPLQNKFPQYSPYMSMDDNPVALNDPNGDCATCVSGLIIGVLTEALAQVGSNMLIENQDLTTAISNIDGTDVLVAGGIGFVSGAIDGGASKMVKFMANPRNRHLAKIVLKKSMEVIIEFTENCAKDYFNTGDWDAEQAIYGALIEVGFSELLPDYGYIKESISNANNKIKRLRKKVDKNGVASARYKKQLEAAEKDLAFWRKVEVLVSSVEGAPGEVLGNEGGEAAKEKAEELRGENPDKEKATPKKKNITQNPPPVLKQSNK